MPGTPTRLDPGPPVSRLEDSFVLTARSPNCYLGLVLLSRARKRPLQSLLARKYAIGVAKWT
jgi:hypothetical protein